MKFSFEPRLWSMVATLLLAVCDPAHGAAQDAQVEDAGVPSDGSVDAELDFIPGPWMPPEQRARLKQTEDTGHDEAQPDRARDAGTNDSGFVSSKSEGHESDVEQQEVSAKESAESQERAGQGASPPLVFERETSSKAPEPGAASELSDLVSVVVDETHGPAAFWGWLVLALLAWLLDQALRKREASFTDSGFLPSVQSIAALLWRASLLMALLFFVLRAVPSSWLPELKWVVLGGLLIAVWTVRGVLTDLVARIVIAIDGKVRPRLMIQTSEITGRVARVGIRKTDVVDAIGRTWALPNRRLLSARVREPSETHVHASLTLNVPDKRVIEDAALASAWIHPNAVVHVWRDESDPNLWHVETELISHDYERVFRSDLAERVREYLRDGPPTPIDKASKSSEPAASKPPEASEHPS